MGCCTARTATWIVSVLHLILTPIGAILYTYYLCLPENKKREFIDGYDTAKDEIFHMAWVGATYCILTFIGTIICIVGIVKNRSNLIEPFKFLLSLGAFYWVFAMVRDIYKGVKADTAASEIAIDVVVDFIFFLFQVLCHFPVTKLRNQLRAMSHNVPEQHSLRTNQNLNKPY